MIPSGLDTKSKVPHVKVSTDDDSSSSSAIRSDSRLDSYTKSDSEKAIPEPLLQVPESSCENESNKSEPWLSPSQDQYATTVGEFIVKHPRRKNRKYKLSLQNNDENMNENIKSTCNDSQEGSEQT